MMHVLRLHEQILTLRSLWPSTSRLASRCREATSALVRAVSRLPHGGVERTGCTVTQTIPAPMTTAAITKTAPHPPPIPSQDTIGSFLSDSTVSTDSGCPWADRAALVTL